MKKLFNHRFSTYGFATMGCLSLMIGIDYLLGAEAEYLNAWVIVNRLIGFKSTVEDSIAIQQFGLAGAALLMISVNALIAIILVKIIHFSSKRFTTKKYTSR